MQSFFRSSFLCIAGCYCVAALQAQQDTLREVTVTGYLSKQLLSKGTAAISVIDSNNIKYQPGQSMVPLLNTVPGVRMEERSPGSYRLSIRGSLLRSPFGVRNIKVYLDELPLTDASGNTYLNAVSVNGIQQMEVFKGPDGSVFGANSGGVLLMRSAIDEPDNIKVGTSGGSFGLFNEYVTAKQQLSEHTLNVHESYQRSDGYRNNAGLNRMYMQVSDRWQYNNKNELSANVFYSDMHYQTPGGLTLAQYDADPHQSRPAAGAIPGAAQQHAGVYTNMLFGGITHKAKFSSRVSNVLSVFGSNVDFRNPFITNYEARKENTIGARTYFSFTDVNTTNTHWENNVGVEWQQTNADINVYDNNSGEKGNLQSANKVRSRQYFVFNRFKLEWNRKLVAEASVSLNNYQYRFTENKTLQTNFDPQLMPRVGISWLLTPQFTLRGVISRGYSVPTTAEVMYTDEVNQQLQPETGWNYEAGIRLNSSNRRLWIDLAAFYYRLSNAIVRRVDDNGNEFYRNAGGTNQKGLESQIAYTFIKERKTNGFIRHLQLINSYTISLFKFRDYSNASNDYSGNDLTGVPRHNVLTQLIIGFPNRLYVFSQYNYVSKLPLNDANTVYANEYHLIQIKAGWKYSFAKLSMELFAGIDNLLDQRYSLGNDINAAGNRYYNAAATRNYFAGVAFRY